MSPVSPILFLLASRLPEIIMVELDGLEDDHEIT